MAADTDLVRHTFDGVSQGQQNVFEIWFETRAARVEHRPVFRIHDLDTQAVLSDLEQNLVLEFLQLRVFLDLGLQFLEQHLQTFLLHRFSLGLGIFRLKRHGVRRRRGLHLGVQRLVRRHLWRTAQIDHIGRTAVREADRVLEITGDRE